MKNLQKNYNKTKLDVYNTQSPVQATSICDKPKNRNKVLKPLDDSIRGAEKTRLTP